MVMIADRMSARSLNAGDNACVGITTTANTYTHTNNAQIERAGEVMAQEIGPYLASKSLVAGHQASGE